MRRLFAMKTSAIIAKSPAAASAVSGTAATTAQAHGHSHGGHGHAHSHGSIEQNISGKFLRQCQMATLAGGATNVFFCVTKLWIGSAGGSVALVADGFHALTDILADIISYVAISLSQKKLPRCRFPFGIGRLETSGAVLVAAILFFGGVALLVQSLEQCVVDVSKLLGTAAPTGGIAAAVMMAVRHALAVASGNTTASTSATAPSLTAEEHGGSADDATAAAAAAHGHSHDNSSHGHNHSGDGHHGHSHFEVTQYDETTGKQIILWTMVGIAATSVVCKELLFRWTRRVGLRAGSRVVVANAYHHRADAWSGGVALIGVAGQLVGLPGIDGLAGLAVSLSICKIGYGLFRDAVLEFFDFQHAEEVSEIREQLQKFNVRIVHGTEVVPEVVGDNANAAAASACSSSADFSSATDASAVHRKKISFMNVFLVRHGHKYALHVTLLVHESVRATQIQEAINLLTALARGSLPVQDTFTSLLVCSSETMPREEYLGSTDQEEEDAAPHDDHDHGCAEHAKKDGKKPSPTAASEPKSDSDAEADKAAPQAAATGNIVNPSLERCIAALQEFHTFSSAIRYNWEERTITVPSSESCECERDIASVADMFKCQLVGMAAQSSSSTTHSHAEDSHLGHSHEGHAHHSH